MPAAPVLMPAGHEVQVVAPASVLYLPTSHRVHAVPPPLMLYEPAAQRPKQLLLETPPRGYVVVPGGHAVQLEARAAE